jgi:hypothetical protein
MAMVLSEQQEKVMKLSTSTVVGYAEDMVKVGGERGLGDGRGNRFLKKFA